MTSDQELRRRARRLVATGAFGWPMVDIASLVAVGVTAVVIGSRVLFFLAASLVACSLLLRWWVYRLASSVVDDDTDDRTP